MSVKGSDPSLSSSMVNLIFSCCLLRWSSSNCPLSLFTTERTSSTYRFHTLGAMSLAKRLSKIFCLWLVSWEQRIMMKTQSGSLKSYLRNFGLYNCQIFPRRRSFRFVRRKITHSTIETDASRAFDASSAGLAVRPYLLYNFSCISYNFCRMSSIFEISGFSGISNFLLLLHNFG